MTTTSIDKSTLAGVPAGPTIGGKMQISHEDIFQIERDFGLRNGAWTKIAVEYVGLSFPLTAGCKARLVEEGSVEGSPHDDGMSVLDFRFLRGEDIEPNLPRLYIPPEMEVKQRIDAIDVYISTLRRLTDAAQKELRKLRELNSPDEW